MHIFIDESGTFQHDPSKDASPSAVGALVVPSRSIKGFEKLYGRLRIHLPKEKGEVKGRRLSEVQLGDIIDVLKRVGCIFEAVVIDTSMHSSDELAAHKLQQEEALTANLTNQHYPSLIKGVWDLRRQLECTSLQLYVQSVVLNEVIYNVLNLADTYFAFRFPKELGSYHWVLDAKERDKTTPWEEWWFKTVLPMIQSKTISKPFMMAPGANYSYHERFRRSLPEYLRDIVSEPDSREHFDPRLVMTESFRFSSEPEFGLEAVDVLTNCLRRSLAGNFSRPGWLRLRELMVHRAKGQYVTVVHLGDTNRKLPSPSYSKVLRDFRSGGRVMLPRNY